MMKKRKREEKKTRKEEKNIQDEMIINVM